MGDFGHHVSSDTEITAEEKSFPSRAQLEMEAVTSIPCPIIGCDRVLPQSSALRFHLVKAHRIIKNDSDARIANRIYSKSVTSSHTSQFYCPDETCIYHSTDRPTVASIDLSSKYFTSFKALKQHYLKLHAIKKFQCQFCGRAFGQRGDNTRHQSLCPLLRTCKDCSVMMSTVASLTQHCTETGHHPSVIAPSKQKEKKNANSNICENNANLASESPPSAISSQELNRSRVKELQKKNLIKHCSVLRKRLLLPRKVDSTASLVKSNLFDVPVQMLSSVGSSFLFLPMPTVSVLLIPTAVTPVRAPLSATPEAFAIDIHSQVAAKHETMSSTTSSVKQPCVEITGRVSDQLKTVSVPTVNDSDAGVAMAQQTAVTGRVTCPLTKIGKRICAAGTQTGQSTSDNITRKRRTTETQTTSMGREYIRKKRTIDTQTNTLVRVTARKIQAAVAETQTIVDNLTFSSATCKANKTSTASQSQISSSVSGDQIRSRRRRTACKPETTSQVFPQSTPHTLYVLPQSVGDSFVHTPSTTALGVQSMRNQDYVWSSTDAADQTSCETQTFFDEFLATFGDGNGGGESCSTQTLESFLLELAREANNQVDVGIEEIYLSDCRVPVVTDTDNFDIASVKISDPLLSYPSSSLASTVDKINSDNVREVEGYDRNKVFSSLTDLTTDGTEVCSIHTQTVGLWAAGSQAEDDFFTEYLATGSQTLAEWKDDCGSYSEFGCSTETQTTAAADDADFDSFLTHMETQTNDDFLLELGLEPYHPSVNIETQTNWCPVKVNVMPAETQCEWNS